MSPITRETLAARIATLEADSNISIKEGFYLQTMRLLLAEMDKPAPHHNGMMQLSNELASVNEALRRLSAFARSHAGDIQYTGDHPIAVAEKLAGQSFGNAEQLETAPAQFESLAGVPVNQPYKLPFEQWLSQQSEKVDVDCGCVSIEVLMRWMRKAYGAGNYQVFGSEPVAWRWFHLNQWHVTNDEERARDLAWDGVKVIPLYTSTPAQVVPENYVTAEHRRVIEMLLNVCGAAFELADDSCQQDVDGEECHVVPDDAFQKLSDALDEIENTLPTEDVDRPDVFLAWSAMPRAALKSILQAGNSPVTPDGWIPVSERMPDKYDFDIWVFSPSKGIHDGIQWDGCEFADDEYQFKINDVSHWMKKTYPAAPQQEDV